MHKMSSASVLGRLRALFRDVNHVTDAIDAYIVPCEDAHQSEYIAECDARIQFVSGFTGSRACCVISEQAACLWTDGRYFIQAKKEMSPEWTLMKEGVDGTPTIEKYLSDTLSRGARVGVDPLNISHTQFETYQTHLKQYGINLVGVTENLVDLLWTDSRPAQPASSIIILNDSETGASWQSKLAAVRESMKSQSAKLLVVSALDEVCWLFNIRAADIPYNPVLFAYAIVGTDFVSLFVHENKLSDDLRAHLNSAIVGGAKPSMTDLTQPTVNILPYSAVRDYLTKYVADACTDESDRVWLPAESTSHALASIVEKNRRVTQMCPIQMKKAVKNAAEMTGMRNAHLRDAVACCEYLQWLEKQMASGKAQLTECSVADKVDSLRREQADFISLSFPTISAVGANAAQPHYKTCKETDVPLDAGQVYLCDSGAQYRDGTTDITRTVCFEPVSTLIKECNTRVLKGHINLAMLNFPSGVNGMRLDTISRVPLWQIGLNFLHGTGHGVGHFLNVHEGPAGIGFRSLSYATVGIVKGMVLTIEPGYYHADSFGIRIENVYEVVEAQTQHSFEKFLTFSPITFVPIQTKMILPELLNDEEIKWLNDYHVQCLDRVGPLLKEQGKADVYQWLVESCAPLG